MNKQAPKVGDRVLTEDIESAMNAAWHGLIEPRPETMVISRTAEEALIASSEEAKRTERLFSPAGLADLFCGLKSERYKNHIDLGVACMACAPTKLVTMNVVGSKATCPDCGYEWVVK